MKKTVFLATFLLLAVGMAAGQADQVPDQPRNNTQIPDLPSQASDTAKQVIDTVNRFLSGSIDNLGQALQNLLGNQAEQPTNNTTEG